MFPTGFLPLFSTNIFIVQFNAFLGRSLVLDAGRWNGETEDGR